MAMMRLWRQQWVKLKKRLKEFLIASNLFAARAAFERDLEKILSPLSWVQQVEIRKAFGDFDAYWSGLSYNERIWKNQIKLKNEIMSKIDDVVNGLLDKEKLIKEVGERYGVGESFAKRLVVTELTAAKSIKTLSKAQEQGKKMVSYANDSGNPCPICKPHIGKWFPIEEGKVGVNLPPLHPYCRGYILTK